MSKKLTKKFASDIAAATAIEMGGWSTVIEMSAATDRATIYFTKDYYIVELSQNGKGQLTVTGDYSEIGKLEVMGAKRPVLEFPSDRMTTAKDIVQTIRDRFLPAYAAMVDEVVEVERKMYYATQAKEMLANELAKPGGRTLSVRHGGQPEISGDTNRWFISARVLAPDKVNLVVSTDADLAMKIIRLLLENK